MSTGDVFLSESDWTLDDVGYIGESAAADRFDAHHVANDASTPDWVDVVLDSDLVVDGEYVASSGTPVQVKLCQWRVRDGQSRRQGRWLLYQDSLKALVDARGLLALGVHDPQLDEPIVLDVFYPRAIRALGLTWVENRVGGREVARLRWGRVFADELVDGTRDSCLESLEGGSA